MGISKLLSTSIATNSSSIDITTKINSTYDEYLFVFTGINPATNNAEFSFQANASGSTGYNRTITSTTFFAYNQEDDGGSGFTYTGTHDQQQGTSFQPLAWDVGDGADECCAGILRLFGPASTTYLKNFYSRFSDYSGGLYMYDCFTAGYINEDTAIDDISFKMSTGNFDGTIQMYGIS